MGPASTIFDLLDASNNLAEVQPSWNKQSTIIGVSATFLILLWACVAFRLYTRFMIVKAPGWDDLFVVIVMISSTLGSTCISVATDYGMGEHFILLPYDDVMKYLLFFYIANATYTVSTTCVKISLLLQYLRIYKNEPLMRRICQFLAIFTAFWGIAYSVVAWMPCVPAYGYWTWTIRSHCYGFGSLNAAQFFGTYASHSIINMVLDILVLAVPIPLYFRKNTQRNTKLGLLGLFFMGACVNFLSIWRLATIIQHKAATKPTFDPTWYGPISILLAVLEVDVAGICASVPVFWPVLTAKMNGIFVTQEIKIERTHRFSAMDEDAIELDRKGTREGQSHGSGKYTSKSESSLHSRAASIDTLNKLCSVGDAGKKSHYTDQYVVSQVDPFGPQQGGVEAEITANGPSRKKSKRLAVL